MDKYINANEFRAMMFHGAFEEDSDLQRWDGGCWIRYRMFERALEQIEPADVVEVKRGQWIPQEYMSEIDSFTYTEYKCSNCGEISKKKSNYCPNCGASMMKGEANG